MVFVKHKRKFGEIFGARYRKIMTCCKCEIVIELGDVFYSKITNRHGENFIRHFCEDCYEKQFVTV
jgi:hypothetical protein